MTSNQLTQRFRVDVGVVDGATLLEWIHQVAHDLATRWSGRQCVAANVGNLHLDRPIRKGEAVELHASIVYTGRTSMHMLVTVYSRCAAVPTRLQIAQCPIVFVALDGSGVPVDVPAWTPVTMLDLQRHRQARVRIRTRRRIDAEMAEQNYFSRGPAYRVEGRGILRGIDEAACRCGTEWIGAQSLTSYVAGIRFERPIATRDRVDIAARVIHTRARSVHVGVEVTTIDGNGDVHSAARGVLVVVALDERGNARPVPCWDPVSDEDRRLDAHARQLSELGIAV